ncbi:MAG TPA: SMP-30/gluconolactonase/LRE family protein, partial [Reyranella sp.]
GTPEIACALQGVPAGLGFLQSGEAVVTDMHGRSLVRCAGGQPVVHAELSGLTGTLDDMTVDKVGRAYVGDLGFDLKSGIKNGPYGRIVLVEVGREPRVVADGLNFPNGIAISEDGRQLVVAETNGDCLASFHIRADGSLEFERRFGQFRAPDGICMDRDQAVWASLLDESSFVRVAPDGRILDRIAVPGRRGVACVLGGDDRKTLFCVSMDPDRGSETGPKSQSYVDAAVVEVPGAGYP